MGVFIFKFVIWGGISSDIRGLSIKYVDFPHNSGSFSIFYNEISVTYNLTIH